MTKDQLLEILRTSFQNEWYEQTRRSDPYVDELVADSFLIDQILYSVNKKIENSGDRDREARYQRILLIGLSRVFAQILSEISDGGANVNRVAVQESQKTLKSQGICPIHPCTKVYT